MDGAQAFVDVFGYCVLAACFFCVFVAASAWAYFRFRLLLIAWSAKLAEAQAERKSRI